MNVEIIATNDKTVRTDRNGHKYTTTHNHVLNGVVIGTTIKPIELSKAEKDAEYRIKMIQKGKVFECGRGVGISAQGYLYLFTDGTVNNGCADDNGIVCDDWKFESVEKADKFLSDWKAIQSMIYDLE